MPLLRLSRTDGKPLGLTAAGGSDSQHAMGLAVRGGHAYVTGAFQKLGSFGISPLITSKGTVGRQNKYQRKKDLPTL